MKYFAYSLIFIVGLPISALFLLPILLSILITRLKRTLNSREKPCILWGPTAIKATQYYSQACETYGYISNTLMYASEANSREDFDYYPETLFPALDKILRFCFKPFPVFHKLLTFWLLHPYLCFLWALPRYEVHFHCFDGGLLRKTPLNFLEIHFWHWAGGKKVVYHFGGDAQVLSKLHDTMTKCMLMRDYPLLAKSERIIDRRLWHYTKTADFIYTCGEGIDYLPYWNLAVFQIGAIDTSAINPSLFKAGPLRKRFGNKKIILHAPNHRHLKGTELIIRACQELRAEGRNDFELVIYEKKSNAEILQAIYDSDIIIDQLILGYYAIFAMESMALRKPVLCYLRPDLYEFYSYYSWGKECPVVNTHRNQIKEKLLWLLDHPEERSKIGESGRKFVEKYHSLKAMGKIYDQIIRKVWFGDNQIEQLQALWPDSQ